MPSRKSSKLDLDALRAKNIHRNEMMQQELKLAEYKDGMPRISSRVVKQRGTAIRKERPERFTLDEPRTYSQSGTYHCVKGCPFVAKTTAKLVRHLKDDHKLPMTPSILAPLRLARCLLCDVVFAAMRGMKNHIHKCKLRSNVTVIEKLGVSFPKKCWGWWEAYNAWYPGTAFADSDQEFCLRVDYKATGEFDAVTSDELFFLVSFVDPDSESTNFLPPTVGCSPTIVPPSQSSVLSAIGCDDLDSTDDLQPEAQELHEETSLSLTVTQLVTELPPPAGAKQGGVVIIKGDGDCCFHLAGVLGELCRDENAVASGFASCNNASLFLARKQILANFGRFRARLRGPRDSITELEAKVFTSFGESSEEIRSRASGKAVGLQRWGLASDLSLYTMFEDLRVVTINAGEIVRSTSDAGLLKACVTCELPGESQKQRVVCCVLSKTHWDLGVVFGPQAKAVFNFGAEWDEARTLILNFLRSRAPIKRGDKHLPYGEPWKPTSELSAFKPTMPSSQVPPVTPLPIKPLPSPSPLPAPSPPSAARVDPPVRSEEQVSSEHFISSEYPTLTPGGSPLPARWRATTLDFSPCEAVLDAENQSKRLCALLPEWFRAGSSIPDDFQASKTCVTSTVIDLHQKSAFLRSLPPLSMWPWALKRKWNRSTKEFVPYFEQALSTPPSSAEMLKLFLRVLELPAIALRQETPERKGLSDGRASLNAKLKKVETLTLQDRLHDASKILFSHGVCQPSPALFDRLQALHPPLKEPIPAIPVSVPQLSVSNADVQKEIYKKCTEHWDSMDPFGWNTALLHLVRNDKGSSGKSFFVLFSELVNVALEAQVSDLAAFVLSSGNIFGLNKENETLQQERIQKGLNPRERPVNQGSLLLKLAFDVALHSEDAVHAAKQLQPIQQGIGAKRGMEVIAHMCNLMYSEGYAILKLDATNGFQEIKRASLHEAVHRRCPSLLPLFQRYYTKESICFFKLEEEIKLLSSSEGARIGCKLSSFGFGLTVHDTYQDVKRFLSSFRDGSCIKAATDDVVVFLQATPGQDSELNSKIQEVLKIVNKGAAKVGLNFENDKAQVLLPKDWMQSSLTDLPPGLVVRSNTQSDPALRGMEVVGIPVGSPDFCSSFVRKTLDDMLGNAELLVDLHPQCATKILRDCVCPAPAYIAQVCHPNVTREHLSNFDDRVWDLWLRILGGVGGEELACCSDVLARSRLRAFLPCRLDGAGLRQWDRAAEFAWFCSLASCISLSDPDLEYARRFIGKNGEDAYEFAMESLGGPSYLEEHKEVELIPVGEPDVLQRSTFYRDLFVENPKLKLQQKFNEITSLRARAEFLHQAKVHANSSERVLLQSLGNASPGTSILSAMFTAQLSQRNVRLTKTEFRIAVRQFLCLPPLKVESCAVIDAACGCQAQICANRTCPNKGQELDGDGSHSLVCNPGVKAQRATIMEKALEKCFRAAGGRPTRQPSTVQLLGNQFKKEDVAALFPGYLSKKESQERRRLAMRYLDIMCDIPRGQVRTAELGMLREEFPKNPPSDDGNNFIRFDMCFPLAKPDDKPREIWFDHAIVHESSSSYVEDVLKFLEASNTNQPNTSPAFVKMRKKKERHYGSVVAVAERLLAEHKLNFQPKFLFPVISSFGFFNEDMQQLMKCMVNRFKDTQEGEPPREDGIEKSALKGRFRRFLKNTVCFALVKGLALALNCQGIKGIVHPT